MIQSMKFQDIQSSYKQLKNKCGIELNNLIIDNRLQIPEIDAADKAEEFSQLLDKFINQVTEFDLDGNDLSELLGLEDGTNKDFINWLIMYITKVNRSLKETRFLKDLSLAEYEDMVLYCFKHYVYCVSGNQLVNGAKETWTIDNILVLRKVILTVAEMYIMQYYSYEKTLDTIKKFFGLSKEYGEIIIKIIIGCEDRMWKYLIMRKIENLQNDISNISENQCNI